MMSCDRQLRKTQNITLSTVSACENLRWNAFVQITGPDQTVQTVSTVNVCTGKTDDSNYTAQNTYEYRSLLCAWVNLLFSHAL